jgi:hypothetical protein
MSTYIANIIYPSFGTLEPTGRGGDDKICEDASWENLSKKIYNFFHKLN